MFISSSRFGCRRSPSDFQPLGDFDLSRDTSGLFGAAPDDVFLIKVSYWLNP